MIQSKNEFLEEGKKLLASANYSDAADLFVYGLDKHPKDIALLVGMANAEFRLGNRVNALRLLIYANHLAPGDEDIKNFLQKVGSRVENDRMPEITLSMIVKNEENDLPVCLESVKGVVDEIVIVDTGSTDRTMEIARDYGAKLYQTEWQDDFSRARNVALRYSTGKWVLYLDADESLDKFSQNILRNTVDNAPELAGGLNCNIFSKHPNDRGVLDMFAGTYPRLFRNLGYPVCKFFGRVHEQISPSLSEKGYVLVNSEIRIIHTGYELSLEEMDKKVRRNLQRLTDHVREEPESGLAWYQLGNSLAQMKIYDQAVPALETSVKCSDMTDYMKSDTALRLAMIFMDKSDNPTAQRWIDEALRILPDSLAALEMKAKLR